MSKPPHPSPHPWEIVFQQAAGFYSRGQLAEAGTLFAAILEHNPDHFPSLHRLASIRRLQGQLQDSVALLRRAIECDPSSAEARNSLGNTLNFLGRPEEALEQYRAAIELRPDFPEAHLNLGNCLKNLGRFEEAAAAYQAAIGLQPGYTEAHTNLGIVLDRLGRPEDALASFSAAIAFDPWVKLGYSNLGSALTSLNRHEEALSHLHQARLIEPDAPQPVFNEAVVHLAMGNLARGWPDYEARWRVPELKMTRHEFPQPMWDGTSLTGRTILLHAEQGLGDTILFTRFVEPVAAQAGRVILAVQKPLAALVRAIPGVTQVLTTGDALPDFDVHAPLGSLPMLLHATLETIPSATGYLRAPARSETITALGDAADPRPLIGICWAGSASYPNDHNRSIPLALFQRLFEVPGVRFVSLQQNLRPGDDAILARYPDIDLTSDSKGQGLADTAALISRLDLVVTVDTVIGHLAGALGHPVWVLLPFSAYWAWLRHREDSPWYASARLFRQPQIGAWPAVLENVAAALAAIRRTRLPQPHPPSQG